MRPAEQTYEPILGVGSKIVWVRVVVSLSLVIVTAVAVMACEKIFSATDVGFNSGILWGMILNMFYVMNIPPKDAKAWKIVLIVVLLPFLFVFATYAMSTVW